MSDLNYCSFIGRLGKDPELKYLASGSAVVNFSIAVGEKYKNKAGEQVENTEWVNIVAFGKLAEIIGEYLKKGSVAFISGKMKTDKYEKDGVTRYSTKIIADRLQMLGGNSESKPAGKPKDNYSPKSTDKNASDDGFGDTDIPF